jgi:hypothetical protein
VMSRKERVRGAVQAPLKPRSNKVFLQGAGARYQLSSGLVCEILMDVGLKVDGGEVDLVEGCELGKLSRFARFWFEPTRLNFGMVRQIRNPLPRQLVLSQLLCQFTFGIRKDHDFL